MFYTLDVLVLIIYCVYIHNRTCITCFWAQESSSLSGCRIVKAEHSKSPFLKSYVHKLNLRIRKQGWSHCIQTKQAQGKSELPWFGKLWLPLSKRNSWKKGCCNSYIWLIKSVSCSGLTIRGSLLSLLSSTKILNILGVIVPSLTKCDPVDGVVIRCNSNDTWLLCSKQYYTIVLSQTLQHTFYNHNQQTKGKLMKN